MKSAPDGHGILPGLETGPAAHAPRLLLAIPARLQDALPGTAHLDVLAIVASSRQLDAPECDGALQRHLDGCLLHAIFPIEGRVAR